MSEIRPADQVRNEFLHYAVVDKNGVLIQAPSLRDARSWVAKWNKDNPRAAPHRVVEVFVREVTP